LVLLHDHFLNEDLGTGDTGSVKGGFKLVTNSAGGPGTASESGTNATVSTTGGNNDNSGIVSNNTFDATAYSDGGFSATWVVTSTDDPEANGLNLTLQANDGFINEGAGRPNLLFRFDDNDDSMFHLLANIGATSVDLITVPITMSEVLDGFTLTTTLNEDGWSYSAMGLDSLADASGSWTTTHNYGTLFDSDTYIGAFIQKGADDDKTLVVDRMTVNLIPVPEPSTMLLMLAGVLPLGFIGWRRRRRA
jgi:hypothetical protein